MSEPVQNVTDVIARLHAFKKKAQGDTVSDVKDPSEQGKTTIPVDKDADPSKQNFPGNSSNNDANPGKLEMGSVGASGTLEGNVPSAPKAKDNETPGENPSNAKSAAGNAVAKSRSVMERLAALKKNASAPAEQKQSTKQKETPKSASKADNVETNDAVASDIQLSPEWHFKLASYLLTQEDIMREVVGRMSQAEGEAAVEQLIKQASAMDNAYSEYGNQFEQGEEFAHLLVEQYGQEGAVKIASTLRFHEQAISTMETEFEKSAYGAGVADAEALLASGALDEGAEVEPVLPGAEGEPSPEEILQIIDMLVESGELPPEVAEQIAAEIAAGGLGGEGLMPEEEALKAASASSLRLAETLVKELTETAG